MQRVFTKAIIMRGWNCVFMSSCGSLYVGKETRTLLYVHVWQRFSDEFVKNISSTLNYIIDFCIVLFIKLVASICYCIAYYI